MALLPPRAAMASITAYTAVVIATRLVNAVFLISSSSSGLGNSTSGMLGVLQNSSKQSVRVVFCSLEITLPSAASPLATRSERCGGAETAGGPRPAGRRLPGLGRGVGAAQHTPPEATRLCRSSHGAGY